MLSTPKSTIMPQQFSSLLRFSVQAGHSEYPHFPTDFKNPFWSFVFPNKDGRADRETRSFRDSVVETLEHGDPPHQIPHRLPHSP